MVNVDPAQFQSMEWRCIGPFRGARVVAVAADPSNPLVFYFGATGGGVWKTIDAGTHWENVSDAFFKTAAVGALAVAPSDPNVIYAGTGESCFQSNESHGDGVYKSADGGRTWTNVGLRDTRHIAKIRIHPSDPDLVYVAALGHTWGPNEERGIFRSKDGGDKLGAGALQVAGSRRHRHQHGPLQSSTPFCLSLSAAWISLDPSQRRPSQRPLPFCRRWGQLDRHKPSSRAAPRRVRQDRSRSIACYAQPGLGLGRG